MRRMVALILLNGIVGTGVVWGEEQSRPAAPSIDWSAFLIHDAAVQAELKLTDAQRQATAKLMDEVVGKLWNLRFLSPEDAAAQALPLAGQVRTALAEILTKQQQLRLTQIVLQNRWPASLLEPAIASKLAVSGVQRSKITRVLERAQAALNDLEKLGQRRDEYDAAAQKIRAQQSEEVLAVLTGAQKKQWSKLTGAPFDQAHVAPMQARAPELASGGEWINSKPLSLTELRGSVVLVHFWTFGCGNCINNYPAYRAWQKAYAGKGLTLIGIHTPETQGERSPDAVRAKVKENELTFPIVVDNDRQNWDAWANGVWPAVYLIDKQGRIRYWWYGELNWQGAGGEKYMTDRIEELLAEKP